ncbi:hypothetical protein FSC37_05415 [Piscinibacter aquaticus]|uniref:Uncharacterized protein n=1 Tax=Piscinibacter aquaticus TaxID=392597 RepID=A0A5C6TYF7_9BURK|nr:hypothetical protein FSC37_05415 [Piscinibacter aquaticus]
MEPAGRLLVPVIVGVESFVSAGASTVRAGAVISIEPASLAEAELPAASLAVAVTVNAPSASAAGTSTENVPPAATVAEIVCDAPSASVTTMLTVEPAGRFVVPVMVGVESFVSAGASTVSVGAVTSTEPTSFADAEFPAASLAVAVTVKAPSASVAGTSTEKVPPAATVAAMVCDAPRASVTTMLTVEPAGRLVVPVMVGVASFVSVGASTVRLGAVTSTEPASFADAELPAASVAVATMLNAPSASAAGTSTE